MNEKERAKLIEKLNKDTEDYVSQLKKKKYEDGWPEDRWEEEMEKHPIFRTQPVQDGKEIPPLVEAFQQLKYDSNFNSPKELAESYKVDGNDRFKKKQYRVAVEAYTKGIEAKCEDEELNAILYTNRAAAHYHIGNYKKALKDATEAKIIKPDHLKALIRGVMCCWNLLLYEDCILWCKEGLKYGSNDVLNDYMKKAKGKIEERKKEAASAANLRKREKKELYNAFKERKIKFIEDTENLAKCNPAVAESKVHLENGKLIWPVMLYFPEDSITAFIQNFHEDACLYDHFSDMFKDSDWDPKYVPDELQAYFIDGKDLIPFDKFELLKSVLSHKKFKVCGYIPQIYITVANSDFDKTYRSEFNVKSF